MGALGAAGLAAAGCGTHFGELLPSTAPLPEPFTVPLPVPATARPAGPGRYEVTQRAAQAEILPGLHGGVNPPDADGYPTDLVVPAGYRGHHAHGHPEIHHQGVKEYRYPVDQRAAARAGRHAVRPDRQRRRAAGRAGGPRGDPARARRAPGRAGRLLRLPRRHGGHPGQRPGRGLRPSRDAFRRRPPRPRRQRRPAGPLPRRRPSR
ncbi:hypothetical protein [Nonomuraea coxensis]|uniref:hypothetical protein n=1 Tax=Nonomuraea coxensis TaxID=404386 RepID=UPI003CCE69F9